MRLRKGGAWAVMLLLSSAPVTGWAESFTCEVPWYSSRTSCKKLFSIPAGKAVTVTVTAIKDSEGKQTTDKKCAIIWLVDAKTRVPALKTANLCKDQSFVWRNESPAEAIVELDANVPKFEKRIIEGSYTVQ